MVIGSVSPETKSTATSFSLVLALCVLGLCACGSDENEALEPMTQVEDGSSVDSTPSPAGERLALGSTDRRGETALQKHVNFFDWEGDGVITLSDTYNGLRALGFGSLASSGMAFAINGALGPSTGASWYAPFSIYVAQIHLGKHGSDTGIYDSNGDYVQSAFNAMFLNYDANQDDELSEEEFEDLYEGQYTDASGTNASRAEFSILFSLASETRTREVEVTYGGWSEYTEIETQEYDVLTRSTLERFYDGSLFYEIAGEPVPE